MGRSVCCDAPIFEDYAVIDARAIALVGLVFTTVGVPLLAVALADAHLAWTSVRQQARALDSLRSSVLKDRAQIKKDLWGALFGVAILLSGIWMVG